MRVLRVGAQFIRVVWMAVFLVAGWIVGTIALLARLALAAIIEGYHMGAQVK